MNDFLGDGALLADIYDCNITFCVYQQKANQFFLVCSWEWPLGNLFGNNVSLVGTRGPGGILFCFACFHFQNFVYFFCHVLNQYQQFSGLRAICWVITFHWSGSWFFGLRQSTHFPEGLKIIYQFNSVPYRELPTKRPEIKLWLCIG